MAFQVWDTADAVVLCLTAFTEQGVAMLSSVLRSERAVQVNVAIMRAFVSLRRMLASNEALARKLAELERHLEGHDRAIKSLFDVIRELAAPPAKPRREIGFHVSEDGVPYRVRKKAAVSADAFPTTPSTSANWSRAEFSKTRGEGRERER